MLSPRNTSSARTGGQRGSPNGISCTRSPVGAGMSVASGESKARKSWHKRLPIAAVHRGRARRISPCRALSTDQRGDGRLGQCSGMSPDVADRLTV
jgi:hypothetical protein